MVPWDTICTPKKQGGLGVINLHAMNFSLLPKHLWKWTYTKENLWSSLAATLQNNRISLVPAFSPLRASFQCIAPLFVPMITAVPGDGKAILFWHHNWGQGTLKFRFEDLYSFTLEPDITLSQFLANWHINVRMFRSSLRTSLSASSQWSMLECSLSILNLSATRKSDDFIWNLNPEGMFSVSSFYNFQMSFPKVNSSLYSLWKLNIPPRMKIFAWQMSLNKLATIDNLKKRGWQLTSFYTLCASDEETVSHLYNTCRFFTQVVHLARNFSPVYSDLVFTSNPHFLIRKSAPLAHREIMAILFFVLWRERCNRIFSESVLSAQTMVEQIYLEWEALHF
ncbi:RNA-directed DNA polymerase (reverse transcriptase)-related family protein [Rhynchospora pubera]|uniref:RNA-directed DNA polymerase (Reverse transcriptase)-related family protein n=1 Tax=Rhynchospora pubera TaxID=906938 RepID=A0AAV8BUU7_9POAL|nr:RNA-directed DNA polymerase (reverse transcriptase)-related family protein [Rhynchospora pubera]